MTLVRRTVLRQVALALALLAAAAAPALGTPQQVLEDYNLDGRIDAYPYDIETGATSDRNTFLQLISDEGSPDGLCVDASGDLWVAVWGGRQVRRYAPSGELTGVVEVPTPLVTSCAFAGPEQDRLVITSAWDELTTEALEAEPLAGRLFSADVGATGRPGNPCRVVRSGWTTRL